MHLFLKLFLLSMLMLCSVSCFDNDTIDEQQKKWLEAGMVFESFAFPFKGSVIQFMNLIIRNPDIYLCESCRSELQKFATGLEDHDLNATLMLDAWGKFGPGILTEKRFRDFGAYDQCLSLSDSRYLLLEYHWPLLEKARDLDKCFATDTHVNDSKTESQDQISWIKEYSKREHVVFMYMTPPASGICIPSQCKTADVQSIIQSEPVRDLIHPFKLTIKSSETLDFTEDNFLDYQLLRFISRMILCSLAATTFISSLLAVYSPDMRGKHMIVRCFDAATATEKLLADVTPQNKPLAFLHGLKTMYLISAILMHVYVIMTLEYFLLIFPSLTVLLQNHIFSTLFNSEFIFVGWNFVASSSLSVIGWMSELEKRKQRIPFTEYISIRALRTLPVTIACLLSIYSLPLISSGGGPLLNVIQRNLTANCVRNGWKELLFISNHVQTSDVCLITNWFIAVDFQLYILAFAVIYFLYQNEKLALKLIIGSIVIGPLLQFVVLMVQNQRPVVMLVTVSDFPKMIHDYIILNNQPVSYISTYGIGMLLGYAIHKGYKVPNRYLNLCWIYVLTVASVTLLSCYAMYDDETFFFASRFVELAYGSLLRPFLASGYFAFILACFSDPDGAVTRFLSGKLAVILSRLSFSTFTSHLFVIIFLFGSRTDPFPRNSHDVASLSFLIIFSIVLGYFTHICVESPFVNLMKGLASRNNRGRRSRVEKDSTIPKEKHHEASMSGNNSIEDPSADVKKDQ